MEARIERLRAVPFGHGDRHGREPSAFLQSWVLQELWQYCDKFDVDRGKQSDGYVFDVRGSAINLWKSPHTDRAGDGHITSTLTVCRAHGEVWLDPGTGFECDDFDHRMLRSASGCAHPSHYPTAEEAAEEWNRVVELTVAGKTEKLEHSGFVICNFCHPAKVWKPTLANDLIKHFSSHGFPIASVVVSGSLKVQLADGTIVDVVESLSSGRLVEAVS